MPIKNPYSNTMIADLPDPETIRPEEILQSFENKDIDLICVLGPTASGKTRYAVALARELNRLRGVNASEGSVNAGAEILSGDSRQVYRGMDIGTGKDLSEYEEIPYHLIDIVDAGTKFDLYQYQKAFEKAYKDIIDRGGIPILCGGSGLYLEAATCGYSIPDVPQSPELRAELEAKSTEELISMLAGLKPLHNKTDIDTRKRLIRALEIAIWQKDHQVENTSYLPKKTYYIGTLVSREERNRRIDARLDARIAEGMADEVKGLLDSGIPAENLTYYGLEYKFVTQYVLGVLSLEEMKTLLGNAIHQFAKRQMTWFRGMERKGIKIHWVEP
ncbi:tRNA dimethylallyltransferase 1 [Bacteroides sp. CAG:770]|uniref:tRNA (adenosine(37)-N6)-dimethylallyltransferase MiaA n=1 Tax=Candidatus Cryptobacteroides bacterium TaxID=3085639 RepID=UPI00033EF8A5|nr:tRNA dimethylallyltransferase 1 [Bacteroides sp. CAG:770]